MTIEKVLELSTGHLPEEAWDVLPGMDWPRMLLDEFGGFFWAPPLTDDLDAMGYLPPKYPAELMRVLRYARSKGCRWVNFDRDADRIPDLPYWEW